ncbi:MAG TPA: hypothetical protein VNT51_07240 [Miltoncostaeaceae bacterium]|nr:hypothetical protein [Miltoncostaeaceae bacterium]
MMPNMRDTLEQAIVLSLGAAALTRDRVEGIVGELVRQGRVSSDEGRGMVERLVQRATSTEGRAPSAMHGVVGQIEQGLRGAFREAGLVTANELDEVRVHLSELEHRLRLVEAALASQLPPAPAEPPTDA